MISLAMMVLTPGPLVRVIFPCVLTILLVILVAWGVVFLYQQDSSPNVAFFRLSCSYQ